MNRKYIRLALALALCVVVAQLAYAQSPTLALIENSGQDNPPAFSLDPDQAQEILNLLALDTTQVSDPQWTNLGWRGFQVDNLSATINLLTVLNGVVEVDTSTATFYNDDGNQVEYYLCGLAVAQGLLPQHICDPVSPSPASSSQPGGAGDLANYPLGGLEPDYTPNLWNAPLNPLVQKKNNCYN
jgi:hypothetical protein